MSASSSNCYNFFDINFRALVQKLLFSRKCSFVHFELAERERESEGKDEEPFVVETFKVAKNKQTDGETDRQT